MSDDYQLIKDLYEAQAKENIVKKWVEKKIADTYVKIEDGWRDCEFKHKGWIKQGANNDTSVSSSAKE